MAVRIIGIDPGLKTTGWGVIQSMGPDIAFIGSGRIRPDDKNDMAVRLREIHEGLAAIIKAYGPKEAAVEETFVNRDPQSALKLGQARAMSARGIRTPPRPTPLIAVSRADIAAARLSVCYQVNTFGTF
jgi:crossover junction endodeoxyribonuclease RuvC